MAGGRGEGRRRWRLCTEGAQDNRCAVLAQRWCEPLPCGQERTDCRGPAPGALALSRALSSLPMHRTCSPHTCAACVISPVRCCCAPPPSGSVGRSTPSRVHAPPRTPRAPAVGTPATGGSSTLTTTAGRGGGGLTGVRHRTERGWCLGTGSHHSRVRGPLDRRPYRRPGRATRGGTPAGLGSTHPTNGVWAVRRTVTWTQVTTLGHHRPRAPQSASD